MKWITPTTLAIALSLCFLNGQSGTVPGPGNPSTARLDPERKALLLEKVGQGKITEAYEDLERESPYEEADAKRLQFLGRNLSRLSENVRALGDKRNAFALAEHGTVQLGIWLDENAAGLSNGEKLEAYGLMGRLHEKLLKDERRAIPFYELAAKQIAPAGWEFESVEKLEELRESLSAGDQELDKAAAFVLKRLIYLQREQRIINDRIAAAAEIRKNRASLK